MAKGKKVNNDRVDPAWPQVGDGNKAVTEGATDRQGALSPFGEVTFPLDTVPYVHPETTINK
ncbi:MAG: hypothetical protein ACRDQ7_26905 [Haloechinothrix sp.]